ncbi:MAG: CoxG family protein [Ardenticatenaceae bacterium]
MKIEGRYTFELPIQVVYDALKDEELLRGALSGQVHFEMTSPTHYKASMDLNVPKFGGHYEGSLDVTKTKEPTFYELSASGNGMGRDVTAEGRVELRKLGPNKTEVHYVGTTDALKDSNWFVKKAAQPIAARFANKGLAHLEKYILSRQAVSRRDDASE